MAARDFDLPAELEALVQRVCGEHGIASRSHDEIRWLVQTPVAEWPVCCGASCQPCVEASKELAREVLALWQRD